MDLNQKTLVSQKYCSEFESDALFTTHMLYEDEKNFASQVFNRLAIYKPFANRKIATSIVVRTSEAIASNYFPRHTQCGYWRRATLRQPCAQVEG